MYEGTERPKRDSRQVMKIAVPHERAPGERRVALTPEIVAKLIKSGNTVAVEVAGLTPVSAQGRSRQEAEKAAAHQLLLREGKA